MEDKLKEECEENDIYGLRGKDRVTQIKANLYKEMHDDLGKR